MNLDEINKLIAASDVAKLKELFEASVLINDIKEALNQYDPEKHDVMDNTIRKDKRISNADGTYLGTVEVARIPLAIQKQIVMIAAAFLGVPKLSATPNGAVEENLMFAITKTCDDNKIDYKFKGIVKKTKSVLQAAELWYRQPDEKYWDGTKINSKFSFRMRVISPALGDTLYPVYDDFGDMVAFGRYYKLKKNEKEIEYFDVYTADRLYFHVMTDGVWVVNKFESDPEKNIKGDNKIGIPNMTGKIPIIYYSQPLTEWSDVQHSIERLEEIFSKLADTNDYNGSPILVASGKVMSFSEKGEAGKLVELQDGAKIDYLTYDSAPESIKLEITGLFQSIYGLTNTPDISFDNMKGLGTFNTLAIKTMFLSAHIKAADSEEIFGEGVQRRINYLKAAMATIDDSLKPALTMKIIPVFNYLLPENVSEIIDNLVKVVDAKLISHESAIKLNPLVTSAEKEIQAIQKEATPADPAVN